MNVTPLMTTHDNHTVLIVDDRVDIADTYTIWLEETYRVRTAYDGREALDLLDETVDVALLDRRMPGLSGDEVLETIRERGLDCRVAMVTAVEPDFDIVDMGFDDYLVKPVTGEQLHRTIERLLSRSSYDDRMREFYSLAAKRTVLEAEKSSSELEESEEYRELMAKLDAVRSEADETVASFEDEDYFAAFRDLRPAESTSDDS